MNPLTLEELTSAIEFISSRNDDDNDGFLDLHDGRLILHTDWLADGHSLPPDVDDPAHYIRLPHLQALGINHHVAEAFTGEYRPQALAEVRELFKGTGGYQRFAEWLGRNELSDDWRDYQRTAIGHALVRWLHEHGA